MRHGKGELSADLQDYPALFFKIDIALKQIFVWCSDTHRVLHGSLCESLHCGPMKGHSLSTSLLRGTRKVDRGFMTLLKPL
jgi:hypothetical protein